MPKHILVVEDEPILAMALEDMLLSLGHAVIGPASRLSEALDLAENAELDAAVLDLNLNGEMSHRVADRLTERGVPLIFATGYGHVVSPAHAHIPVMPKPYRMEELRRAIEGLLG